MTKKSVKTNNKHAVAAMEDSRAAISAFMAVNESLTTALSLVRALNQDARMLGNPEFSKSARRLLRIVERMKDGPNTALWADLSNLEKLAQAAYIREE